MIVGSQTNEQSRLVDVRNAIYIHPIIIGRGEGLWELLAVLQTAT